MLPEIDFVKIGELTQEPIPTVISNVEGLNRIRLAVLAEFSPRRASNTRQLNLSMKSNLSTFFSQ
jgi:hypothetical protein